MKRKRNRLTALVLALAMCFSLLSTTAWAADVEAEEVTAEVVAEAAEETAEEQPQEEAAESVEAAAEVTAAEAEDEEPAEDEGDAAVSAQSTKASGTWGDLTWKLDSSGTLTLSGTGSMGDSIPFDPWEDYRSSVTSVVIGDGVVAIVVGAFSDHSNLKSVTIGNGVTGIYNSAFEYCTSLTSVTIGSNVTIIETGAFYVCPSLKSVTIPANVTTIEYQAFGYTYSGKKVSGFTIYGYDGTAAQTYAESNGFTFVSLGEAAPAAPKISSVKNTSSGVKLSWNKVSGATGYIIYRKSGSSTSYTKVKTITSGSTTSWTDTKAQTNGKKYNYKVKAYKKSDGTTLKSTASSAKSTYRLTSPDISSLKNSSSKKMTVKWGKNSKATGYQIQYSTSSDFSSSKTVTVTSYKTVSKTISSLTKGKKYYVRVRAYKTVSGTKYYSAWSSKKSVKISK